MSEKGFRASFSRLDTFERCPKKYWLRYVKKLSAPRADSLEFGTIVHAALEDTVRELVERNHRGAIPQDVLRAAYEENWTKAGCTDRALYEEGRSMLDKWRERFGEFDAGRVLGLEQRIAFTFGGVQVSGVVDRVDRIDADTIQIVDYKTSRAWMLPDESNQLALYGAAMREKYGAARVRVAFDMLRHNQMVVCDLTPEMEQRTEAWVASLAEQVQSAQARDEYPEKLNAFCGWCDWREYCPTYASAVQAPLSTFQFASDPDSLASVISSTKKRLDDLKALQRAASLQGDGPKRPTVRRTRKAPAHAAVRVLRDYGVDVPLERLTIDNKTIKDLVKGLSKDDRAIASAKIEAAAMVSNSTVVK